jgi:predicted nucleic acid-binding protein
VSSILLDTNVVLRIADRSTPEHNVVIRAIGNLSKNLVTPVLAPQVLVEFWVVATRPIDANGFGWSPTIVGNSIERLRRRFVLLSEGPELLDRWLEIVTVYHLRGKRAHDARLAAIALLYDISQVLTLNTGDFNGIDGITAIHPIDVI